MSAMKRLSDLPGVLVRDVGRYRSAISRSGRGFRSDGKGWISLCNRIESLVPGEGHPGVRCDWTWGSALHAAGVLPSLARSLMRVSLEEWPIEFSNRPRVLFDVPKISFVFAHSGQDRLPQLKRTIRSIFAQIDVPCEVVVVDQSPVPLIASLPMPVSYRHLEKPAGAPAWHKTWAYNVGARMARGSILVFHDGDICVPTLYAQELVKAIEGRGCAAASLQRFLYYLDPADTERVERSDAFDAALTPEMVFQNWKGGTIAITRDGFRSIGGFDEAFVGWGGEDAEFFDRCAAVGHCREGYLPFVHLWHQPQPSKSGAQRDENIDFFQHRMEIPTEERIRRLLESAA
jgi:hypothetical protein